MKELLIFSNSTKDNKELENLGKLKGFTVYSTIDRQLARDLLQKKPINIVLIHSDVKIRDQLELADYLWRRNISAPFVVYNLEDKGQLQGTRVKLYGAETAYGSEGYQKIKKLLELVRPSVAKKTLPSKIVVVDDQNSSLDILCFFVEGLGDYQVIGKESAREALEVLQDTPDQFFSVITDLRMPAMSGVDLIVELRKDPALAHLPIIVLTAYGTGESLIECLKVGASGFLVKPPRRGDLERELGRAARILSSGISPRLASGAEIDLIQDVMIEQRSL